MEKPIIVMYPSVVPQAVRPGEYYVDKNKVMWYRNRNDVRPWWVRIPKDRQALLLGVALPDYGLF